MTNFRKYIPYLIIIILIMLLAIQYQKRIDGNKVALFAIQLKAQEADSLRVELEACNDYLRHVVEVEPYNN